MLHNPSDNTPDSAPVPARRVNFPLGVRLLGARLRKVFAGSQRRQLELERELRHRGGTR